MTLTKKMLDELTAGYTTPQEMESLYSQMLQHMINRSLEAEMQAHVGHERHGKSRGNPRNGSSRKTVQSTAGDLQIETPRDREGTFEPQLLAKRQVRLAGMEAKILALYAKGMTTRDIESALMDLYGVTISHSLIAQVTDAVLDEARLWQTRPLETIYPIVWLDGIVVKVQQNKQVINKSAHVVLGVNLRGEKEVLGLWLAENEGAKFWLAVLTELRQRGVQDIYIASMDGLKGLPEAVNAVFPKTLTQLCIVHLVRASLRYVAEVFDDLSHAEREIASTGAADVLLVHVPVLHQSMVEQVVALRNNLPVPNVIVVYSFGTEAVAEALRAKGVAVYREPVSGKELTRLIVASRPVVEARAVVVKTSPRHFSDADLVALTEIPSLVACECPRHLAEIVTLLVNFELYSTECASGDRKDADLHGHLYEVTSGARAMLEQALARLVIEEGLVL